MSNSGETLSPFRAEEDPQAYVLASSLGYIWDVGTLEWIKDPGGAGGGGPVTIADGADVAQGSISDAAWVAGDGTVISLLKTIASAGGGAVSIADGSDVAEGATADAAVVTDAAGTVSGKLRGLVKWAFERMPASLGQKAMTASLPVVIASDQSAVPVSGPLTDTQLRAVAVPVSGTVTASGPLTDTQLRATPVPVSGTVTASGPLTDAELRATPVPVSGAITNTTLSVVGGGAEATALRVTVANDSTGLLSVDDNGGSLTVDAPVATPVFVRLSDGAAAITTLPVSIAATVTVAGSKSNNAGVPGATNEGTLPAVATVAAPTYTEGNQVALSTDLTGAVRITGSISASSTATATEEDPTYTEAQVAAFSQDLAGRLRVRPYGLVDDAPESYISGSLQPLSLTSEGRLRTSTAEARFAPAPFNAAMETMWGDLRPWDNGSSSYYDGSPWNAW